MPININITADSTPQLIEVMNLLGKLGANASAPSAAPAKAETAKPAAEAKAETKAAEKPAEEKKPAAPKKAAAPKASEVEDDGKSVDSTLTGCRIMAKRVAAAIDMQAFLDVLATFKKDKIGDLAEGDYASFIEKCQAKIDGAGKPADAGELFE